MSESPNPRLTGPKVVLLMFGFGVVMVGTLWVYFEFQTRPFRELTLALAEEFPNSRPLVQGGQEKLNEKGEPRILRVLVTVKFDPQEEELFQAAVDRIRQICAQYQDLAEYDELEVHLIQRIPEQEPITRSTVLDLRLTAK
ncbi:MAG: hypothetical protein KDA65_00940 [Planctomycetaceae bacterium]|nr:hypothetical protein [Planctomycetaceae bacterium]